MKNFQKELENTMISEIKDLGYSEIRIDEFRHNGDLSNSKCYTRLIYAVRKMINFAQGEFPIYQGSEVTYMGYKMKIIMN
jgi:ribosome-binding factor A